MSKLRCNCGHLIRDNSNRLEYKAALLKDSLYDEFFDSIATAIQNYVVATHSGQARQWISEKFSEDYADLQLNHGCILHDFIHDQFIRKSRDVFECLACGRILVEAKDNKFVSYVPDSKVVEHVLASNLD
jgi:diphthamide synthase subunit DPH2